MGGVSTGKSTLLNYLFGSSFQVAAGRSSKGLKATLFSTDVAGAREMLVLDSAGLLNEERPEKVSDRRLATFCLAVSNFVLVNIRTKLDQAFSEQDVLETAIYTLGRVPTLFMHSKKPRLHIILRDSMEVSMKQMRQSMKKLRESLEKAAEAAGTVLNNLIDMPGVENLDDCFDDFNNAISPMAIGGNNHYSPIEISAQFQESCGKLRNRILSYASTLPAMRRCINLSQWADQNKAIWQAIRESNDFASIVNLKYTRDQRKMLSALEQIYAIHTNSLRNDQYPAKNPFSTGDPKHTHGHCENGHEHDHDHDHGDYGDSDDDLPNISVMMQNKPEIFKFQTVKTLMNEKYGALMKERPHAKLSKSDIANLRGIKPIDKVMAFEIEMQNDLISCRYDLCQRLKFQSNEFTGKMPSILQDQARAGLERMTNNLLVRQLDELYKAMAEDKMYAFHA